MRSLIIATVAILLYGCGGQATSTKDLHLPELVHPDEAKMTKSERENFWEKEVLVSRRRPIMPDGAAVAAERVNRSLIMKTATGWCQITEGTVLYERPSDFGHLIEIVSRSSVSGKSVMTCPPGYYIMSRLSMHFFDEDLQWVENETYNLADKYYSTL